MNEGQAQIDIDPDQIRQVFEAFGLAMYHAQCLERQLAMVLTVLDDSQSSLSRKEFEDRLARYFSSTFGKLLQSMRNEVEFPESLESRLVASVKKRNWLAHNYFWENAGQILTNEGRVHMVDELETLAAEFDTLDNIVTPIFTTWMKRIGVADKQVNQALCELVEESRVSRSELYS